MKIAFFGNHAERLEAVYAEAQRARLRAVFDVVPGFVGAENFADQLPALESVQAIFSTWGMLKLDAEQLACMPSLKILFYGAGSVRGFAGPLLEKGIRLSGAWRANGEAVAEFTLGQIILACKGYFGNVRAYKAKVQGPICSGPGADAGTTVALLGCGAVARNLIGLLKQAFPYTIRVYDPFLEEATAAGLGVVKSGLRECFQTAHVVSNHMPNLPATQRVLDEACFSRMRENATFINTGRGLTVENEGFLKVFSQRPDLTALLDVTDPEPLPPDSPLFQMPNVQVSRHIAGAIHAETKRLGDRMIDHFYHWLRTGAVRDEITLEILENMA